MGRHPALVSIRGLRKRFGPVVALEGVDLDLAAGEIHALVGENGAGKSTLLRILAGVEARDAGEIELAGRRLEGVSAAGARALGIVWAPQELELFPQRSICENCFGVAALPSRGGWVDWRQARLRAAEALARLGRALPLLRPAGGLAAADRAIVQLAGALVLAPRVLLLDEPTASLGAAEARRLFAILRELAAAGAAIAYVSHRLAEVLALADRVTVLRDGRRIWTRPARGLDEAQLIEAMVGRRLEVYFPRLAPPRDEVLLGVQGLDDAAGAFRDVSLTVRGGEVLGLYGLLGAGGGELVRAIAGLRPATGRTARRVSLGFVPGDRRSEGNLPGRSVRENVSVSSLAGVGPALWLDRAREARRAADFCGRLAIGCPDLEAPIETLSGGNQQKVLLARALAAGPAILVLDEPTRGIDVAARAEIHRAIADLAGAGKAVLLASSDLPEVLGMSHRVAVLREGRLSAVLPAAEATQEAVLRAALPDAAGTGTAPAPGARRRARPWWPRHGRVRREAILIAAIFALVAFTGAMHPTFLTLPSLATTLASAAPLVAGAAGMTAVIATGGVDLAAGSILALAALSWVHWVRAGGGPVVGLAIAAAAGALLGSVNSLLSLALRVQPVVVTLGTMGILRGLFLLWTGSIWLEVPEAGRGLATAGALGLPLAAWVALGLLALASIVLRHRLEGREILALGDNPGAARAHGVRTRRARLAAGAFLGAATGLAAALHSARYGSVQSNTGLGFELEAIAAAVVGGASLGGGRGTAAGAGLGALFLSLLGDVRAVWGIHERWQRVAVGLILLGVIGVEKVAGRGREEDG